MMQSAEMEYIGFWPRVGATLIDTLLVGAIIWPLLTIIYGASYWNYENFISGPMDFLLNWVFPAVFVISFWVVKQATPGKMAVYAKIVDAKTGKPASTGQLIGRYLAYYASIVSFGLGFVWVAFDKRKQGWHDKLAGTVVIRRATASGSGLAFCLANKVGVFSLSVMCVGQGVVHGTTIATGVRGRLVPCHLKGRWARRYLSGRQGQGGLLRCPWGCV